jgi:hypothetical protein
MSLFGRKHFILAVEQIPRDRSLFSATIADARRLRHRSNLKKFATCNFLAWSLIILFVWIPLHRTPTRPTPIHQHAHVYIVKGVDQQ